MCGSVDTAAIALHAETVRGVLAILGTRSRVRIGMML
jgi:hypothetical protein